MTSANITILSIQLRAAAETAKMAGLMEMASWLIATAEALERKFSSEFVK